MRLTLKGVTREPGSVTTTPAAIDKDGVTKKVTGAGRRVQRGRHVGARRATEKSDPKATTTAAPAEGQLFGDTGLTSMLSQLKSQMTQVVTGLGLTGLADLGIDVPKPPAAPRPRTPRPAS